MFEGPPGNGKTSAVHAIAHEIGARLLRVGTTDTGSSYHNVGDLAIRDAFEFCDSARESVLMLIDDGVSFTIERFKLTCGTLTLTAPSDKKSLPSGGISQPSRPSRGISGASGGSIVSTTSVTTGAL